MRVFSAFFLIIALAGCTTLTPNQRIFRSLNTTTPHIWCWRKTVQETTPREMCGPFEVADAEVSGCWDDFVASGRAEDSVSDDDLIQCMHRKGWVLYPLAFAPKTVPVKTCRDFYPIEKCPEELP
jgi:hypothetical protein